MTQWFKVTIGTLHVTMLTPGVAFEDAGTDMYPQ